jgi:hypothetical protein
MLDDIGLRRAVEQATARPKTAWLCRRTNSHHFGVATWHIEPVGALGNSPSAMPAWGAARGRCSAPIRSPRSSRVATDLVTALTGARNARMEILLSIILQDEITRLTGYRRHDLAHRAGQEGLKVSEVTMQK